MTKELITTQNGLDFNDPRLVQTIRATVAKDATDPELAMFLEFAKSTGLNPFKREIWFIKVSGRVQMMAGINGFYAIANSNPEYDGIENGLIDPEGNCVSAAYPKPDYIGAWARVYRKNRAIPTQGIAMLSDYDKKQSNWNTMKRVMIMKCAESVALRKSFPQQLNGLYTAEEMPVEYSAPPAKPELVKPADTLLSQSEFWWDIKKLPEAKRQEATELVNNIEGMVYDTDNDVYRTPMFIKKLSRAQVAAPPKTPEITFTDDDLPEGFGDMTQTQEDTKI